MGVQYRLTIYNTAGTKVGEIGGTGKTSFLELACAKQVNSPGLLAFTLSHDHPAVPLLSDKYFVQIWRRWPEEGIDWYVFFYTMFRTPEYRNIDGREVFVARCPGHLSMLNWRINAYASEVANKTKWTAKPAETIIKDIIKNNFTSIGTTGNGRDRNTLDSGTLNERTITVEADAGRGTVLDFAGARGKCLKTIHDVLAAAGTGDIDFVGTGSSTLDFRYYPLLGTDRTATVTFSQTFGNMRNASLVIDREPEETAIIVGGGGTKDQRARIVRTGTNYSTTNTIEGFANGAASTGGTTNTTVLNNIGDKEATRRRARSILTYDVAQVSASLLDKHYFLGDKVTATAYGYTLTQQVYNIMMTFKPTGAGEEIQVGMRDW